MASKIELIKWINDNFKANIQSLEQLVNGQLFCQIFEYLHPNSIPSIKVNWRASQEIDYIKNFKLLADAFHKANMSKTFDIQSLSKGKYQDLLDVTQFLKQQFDKSTEKRENYNPEEYRTDRKLIKPLIRKPLRSNENGVVINLTFRKKITKKNPSLSEISAIIGLEEDEETKIKKIRQLFN